MYKPTLNILKITCVTPAPPYGRMKSRNHTQMYVLWSKMEFKLGHVMQHEMWY